MKLFIDTSAANKTVVSLDGEKIEKSGVKPTSQEVLSLINQIIARKGTSINKIEAIEVNTGPGSFTGLKVGIAVANTLGFALKVPVNGKRIDKGEVVLPV